MPKTKVNALNDRAIRTAKPKEKDYKLTDGEGLFLIVAKNGGKRWRFKYRIDGKEKIYSIGTYPAISLQKAREIKHKLRAQVAEGISPADKKQEAKKAQAVEEWKNAFTFERLASALLDEWLQNGTIKEATYKRTRLYFVNDAYPLIGEKPVSEITPQDIKSVVSRVSTRGKNESARKLFYALSKVFRIFVTRNNPNDAAFNYGIKANPCASIEINDLIGSTKEKHYPTITDEPGIRALLLAIDDYKGDFAVRQALRLMPYTALRPGNIRFAEWGEIDFDSKLWKIPASKMKGKQEFIIPLTDSMIRILRETQALTGEGRYLFPSYRDASRPMSENTLSGAVRRLGYTKEEFTPHGFRSMFSTVIREKTNFKHEIIEAALAHKVGSKVSQAYNRADYLQQRRELMQWWSDYLDEVKG